MGKIIRSSFIYCIGMALIIAGIAATLWIIIGVIEELGGKLKDTQKLENFNRGLDSLSGVFKKLSLLGRINDVINSLSNFDADVDKLAALAYERNYDLLFKY